MDMESLETVYGITTSSGGSVALGYGVTVGASATKRDPRVKRAKDIFTNETRNNICEKFGPTYGKIVWTLNNHNQYTKGFVGTVLLGAFTLGIPFLFGTPSFTYHSYVNIKADIYDSKNNLIAEYTSESYKKYWVAMYWGYTHSKAEQLASWNSMIEALNNIATQINNDKEQLRTQLLKAGAIKNKE